MKISQQIDRQLKSQGRTSCGPDSPVLIEGPAGGGRYLLTVTGLDDLACQIAEFYYDSSATLAESSNVDLERLSGQLASRLNYLMEPIAPVEIDQSGATVQLRSHPPTRDEAKRAYYEILVKRDGVRLVRFEKSNGSARIVVPMTLTREVLGRLVEDIVSLVSSP